MRIYDISQEVFGSRVYQGDPVPKAERLSRIAEGNCYNLAAFSMCAHNGTHIDAPNHFYETGKTIDQINIEAFVGYSYVISHQGDIFAEDAVAMLVKAREADIRSIKRLLIKGKAVITLEAATVFSEAGIWLIGNESQTVGPEDAPMEVHLKLLGAEVMLLEGICLDGVPDGVYLLNAAPLNLGGFEGAPCRAILMDLHSDGTD